MKNFFNYSVALAALLMLTMNACTEDCEYSPAPIPNNNDIVVSFSSDADNNMEVAPTDAKEMTIEVSRENTDSEVSVPLKVMRNDENIFQIPGSVTFAAGKKTATVKITFPEIKEGVVYKFEILLDNGNIYSDNAVTNTMGSVQCVQWNQLGKGTVASQIYEEQYAVMVYKAGHAKWYKIYSMYEDGKDIVFKVDDANKVTVEKQAALTHNTYGVASIEGSGNLKDGVITVNVELTVSAGSFGFYQEALKLPAE